MRKVEFHVAFQITRKIVFEVEYYTLEGNSHPYFATSAEVFNQPKTDYNQCGQCQKDLLTGKAYKFYSKWDLHHLNDLTDKEYLDMITDLEKLVSSYNYGLKIKEDNEKLYSMSFYDTKVISMMKLPTKTIAATSFNKDTIDKLKDLIAM